MHFAELRVLYHRLLFDLISQARAVHLEHWRGESVQRCSLLSIKTGGGSGGFFFFAARARYFTRVEGEDFVSPEWVFFAAQQTRRQGATRLCFGGPLRG